MNMVDGTLRAFPGEVLQLSDLSRRSCRSFFFFWPSSQVTEIPLVLLANVRRPSSPNVGAVSGSNDQVYFHLWSSNYYR